MPEATDNLSVEMRSMGSEKPCSFPAFGDTPLASRNTFVGTWDAYAMSKAWKPLGERPGGSGYLPITTRRYQLPDGNETDWDIFGPERSVATLALTPLRQVVLARQFRPGPGLLLNEMPGGVVEDGEDPLEAAARELCEETGYAGRCELAGETWLAAGSRTRRFSVVTLDAETVGNPKTDPGEFCETVLVPLETFRQQLRAGQLTDADLGYLALDHLNLL